MPLALLQTLHLTGPGRVSPGYGCYTFDAQRNIFYVVYNNFDNVNGIQIDAVNCNGTLRVIRSARYPAYSQGTLMKYHPGQNALFLITQSLNGSEGYLTKIDAASLSDLGSARYDNQITAITTPYRYYTGAAALYIGGNRYYVAISTQTDPVYDCTDFDILGGNGGNKVQQLIHEFDISGSPSWTQQYAQGAQKNICCMEVNEQTNVMFAETYSNPSKLLRISVPGMGVLETHTFPLDNYFPRISSLALNPDLGYGYCQNEGEQPSPSRIARFSLGNIGLNAINYIDLPTWSATTGNMPQSHLCGNINTANATATQVYFPVLPGETGYNYQVVQANANPFQITDIVNVGSWSGHYLPNVLFDGSRYFGYCARWGSTDILQIGIPRLSGNFHVRHDTGLNNTAKSLKHDSVINGRTTTTGIGMRRKWLLSSAGFAAVQARTGQNAVEILGVGDPEIRVTQTAVETLGSAVPDIRTTQNAVEVLGEGNPDIRTTQTAVEVFGSANPDVRITQIAIEVIAPLAAPPPEPGFGYGHNFAFHRFHDTGPTNNSIPHDTPLNQYTTGQGIGLRRKWVLGAALVAGDNPISVPPLPFCGARRFESISFDSAGNYSWTVPNSIYSIYVECIGAGGGGGNGNSAEDEDGGAGGGGGAYAASLLNVNPGDGFYINVGLGGPGEGYDGGASDFNSGQVSADFGTWGSSTPGLGGLAANCTGQVTVSGGNGFTPPQASPVPVGGATGGTAAGGGQGGIPGGPNTAGGPGNSPGGGGGGGGSTLGPGGGGGGADGLVRVSWITYDFGFAGGSKRHQTHSTGQTNWSILHCNPLNQWTTTKGISIRNKYLFGEPTPPPPVVVPPILNTIRACNCPPYSA